MRFPRRTRSRGRAGPRRHRSRTRPGARDSRRGSGDRPSGSPRRSPGSARPRRSPRRSWEGTPTRADCAPGRPPPGPPPRGGPSTSLLRARDCLPGPLGPSDAGSAGLSRLREGEEAPSGGGKGIQYTREAARSAGDPLAGSCPPRGWRLGVAPSRPRPAPCGPHLHRGCTSHRPRASRQRPGARSRRRIRCTGSPSLRHGSVPRASVRRDRCTGSQRPRHALPTRDR